MMFRGAAKCGAFFSCGVICDGGGLPSPCAAIKTVDLKSDMPTVAEALQRLEFELERARREKCAVVKFIHGYGSSGVGGDIRIAVQKRLHQMKANGEIRDCIFGEAWARSDQATWNLLRERPELKKDPHLGKNNAGITIVVF